MGRIRTIKPEFPKSETVGALSRDARLLFIQLWTEADDSGRLRGASRLLASLLYPYDEDAPALIEQWLTELAEKGCIRRYQVKGNQYVEIANWLEHQKIDRPSPSRLPSFDEGSEIPREDSRVLDDGPSTLDLVSSTEDLGRDRVTSPAATAPEVQTEIDLALEAYNASAKRCGWSIAQRLTEPRRRGLTARLAECGGAEGFSFAMLKAEQSDFLAGRSFRSDGHEHWKPDLDFFLKAKTFTKLMEGGYDNKTGPNRPQSDYQRGLAGLRDSINREGLGFPESGNGFSEEVYRDPVG